MIIDIFGTEWIVISEEIAVYLSFLILIIAFTSYLLVIHNVESTVNDALIITFVLQMSLVISIILLNFFNYVDVVACLIFFSFQSGITLTLLLLVEGRYKNINIKLFTIIVNNLLAFHLSNYTLIECLIHLSLYIFAYFIFIAENADARYQDKLSFKLLYQSYANLICVNLGFKKNILLLIAVLFFCAFYITFVETKENFYAFEREISTEKSIKNKVATLLLYYNLTIRRVFNYFNKDILNSITYLSLILIIGLTLTLVGLYGYAYLFTITIVSLDFNSRTALKNWQQNPLYKTRALNNVNAVQARNMHRAATAAAEYAAANPSNVAYAAGTTFTAGLILYQAVSGNKAMADNTAAIDRQTAAIDRQTEAINKQDNNKTWASQEIPKTVTPEHQEGLNKVKETGDMSNIKDTITQELAARGQIKAKEEAATASAVNNNSDDVANNTSDSNCIIS